MDPKELAVLMKMPEPAYPGGTTPIRDPRGSGWSYVPPSGYSEMQMAEYALAHKLYERDQWRAEVERLKAHAVTLAETARQVERARCLEICERHCSVEFIAQEVAADIRADEL